MISYTISFVLVMVLPVTAFLTDARSVYILLSCGILFTALVIGAAMVVPKIILIFTTDPKELASTKDFSGNSSTGGASTTGKCPKCGYSAQSESMNESSKK